jgi:hypothetical protein
MHYPRVKHQKRKKREHLARPTTFCLNQCVIKNKRKNRSTGWDPKKEPERKRSGS